MERKLKILKAVLLLRRFNRHETKEKQIAMVDKYYSDWEIDEWIDYLKNPEPEPEFEEEPECIDLEERYTPSCTAHDYSPLNPWDAPGMSISDFI